MPKNYIYLSGIFGFEYDPRKHGSLYTNKVDIDNYLNVFKPVDCFYQGVLPRPKDANIFCPMVLPYDTYDTYHRAGFFICENGCEFEVLLNFNPSPRSLHSGVVLVQINNIGCLNQDNCSHKFIDWLVFKGCGK